MGCGSCGVGGCQNKGGCSSGSCNKMNVHNWLADVPVLDNETACKIIEVSFNNGSRKDFFLNSNQMLLEKGELIAVEGTNGFDVGSVSLTGELVRLQMKKRNAREDNPEIKKVLRNATETDIAKMADAKAKEGAMLIRARAIAKTLNLSMKIAQVEIQADSKKATYFYIADDRVDFRELIKVYAGEFKVKVEMRQIGARQEAGKVGGIGSCGRELCCSSWLTDFKSVNTNAARYQNLSINQTKLSGQCGRLKCCLNFELDTYMDALQYFPDNADMLETAKGRAFLNKKDIFRNLMWYNLADSSKPFALTIEKVREIKQLNQQGIRPEEIETVEVVSSKPKEVEPEYADIVGQISLRNLEKVSRRRRDKERGGFDNNRNPNNPNRSNFNNRGNNQGPRPQNPRGPQQAQNRPPQGARPNNNPSQPQQPGQNRPPQGAPRGNNNRGNFKPNNRGPRPNNNGGNTGSNSPQ
jgi:cell fate regulator YaaT (PSP1 superfamily)